jgi:energy-coupling factor transport system permease protein
MNLFLYLDRESPVHRLDPRTKLFLMLGSFAVAVLFVRAGPLLALLGVLLAYGAVGRSLGNLRRIWGLLVSIALVSILSWSVFARGTTPIVWRVTWEGLAYGVGAAVKIDAMILSGLIFLSTTKTEEMVLGLIRMVPSIIGTAVVVAEAQRSRGLDLDAGGLVRRVRNYIPLLVPIFLYTLRSTDQLAKALESRGFGAKRRRTSLLEIGFHGRDAVALILGAVVCGLFLAVRLTA